MGRVRWEAGHQKRAFFKIKNQGFQATLSMARTQENAMVIARACYVLFANGLSADEAKVFRKECYDKISGKEVKVANGHGTAERPAGDLEKVDSTASLELSRRHSTDEPPEK